MAIAEQQPFRGFPIECDSWAKYMHPCWGEVLASQRLRAKVFNFADPGSLCGDLHGQGTRSLLSPQVPKAAGGLLARDTLVVIHTGGNDFIQKMVEGVFGGGVPEVFRANPGVRESEKLKAFLDTMYRGGARNFLVSGVPAFPEMPIWNMVWPLLTNLMRQGKLADLGVSPDDDPRLALDVQISALHDRWEALCNDFNKQHPDARCVFFDEVGALERVRTTLGAANFDRQMWDFSMFHPSVYGHVQLASEAHRCTAQSFPELATLAPHPEVSAPAANAVAHVAASASPPKQTQPSPAAAPAAAAQASSAEWECSVCTLANSGARTICEACETEPPKAAAIATAPAPGKAEPQPMTIKVRNVKGDVNFEVECDKAATVDQLKAAVVKGAPSGFAREGATCVIALGGKFLLQGSETLTALGVQNNTQVIAVMRAASTGAPAAKAAPAAAAPSFDPAPRT